MSKSLFFLFLITPFCLLGKSSLLEDLQTLQTCHHAPFPTFYSHFQQVGYFTTPSARMEREGVGTLGIAIIPPYRLFGLHYQFFKHLDLAFHYWIFHQEMEKNFGSKGFGDDADRAASLKIALYIPQDLSSFLPHLSVGWDDFMGTKRFSSLYGVMTKSLLEGKAELSLGWAEGRMKGPFGALFFAPFLQGPSWIKGVGVGIEYDPTDYARKEEHPKGKKVSFPINGGIQYRLKDLFHFTLSSLRGRKIAFSTGLRFDIGNSEGLFPKKKNPPLYPNSKEFIPIGPLLDQKEWVCQLKNACKSQGFGVYSIEKISEGEKNFFRLGIINGLYRKESDVKKRLLPIILSCTNQEKSEWIVTVLADGIFSHEYVFHPSSLEYMQKTHCCGYVQNLLFIQRDLSFFSPSQTTSLFSQKTFTWTWTVRPRLLTYFGSAKGKLKYDLGFLLESEGFFPNGIYYDLQGSYIAFSTSKDVGDRDCLNPSLLPHVRSDFVRYYQTASAHLDVAYLQKNWNLSKGWFSRIALGYYEIAYGGITGELLYYPIHANWSFGVELSTLLKRNYSGIGFARSVQILEYNQPKQIPFWGLQYFFTLGYHYSPLDLDFSAQIGQFLAKDRGVRLEVTRSFSSGLHLGFWYTVTNGKDELNGKRYFDKGIAFSMPLDFFLNKSSRERVGYAMSAWLRDVGAVSLTGKKLLPLLNEARRSK